MAIILASTSPRRSEILKNLGVDFKVAAPCTDEYSSANTPGELTEELARQKALDVRERVDENDVVIACDTVVWAGGRALGKPKNADEAAEMLRLLSGKTHEVYSGICVARGSKVVTAHEVTRVRFAELSDHDVAKCIALGAPYDKAGSYAVQGIASLYIDGIDGDYFNVVGLPVRLLYKTLLDEFDVELAII